MKWKKSTCLGYAVLGIFGLISLNIATAFVEAYNDKLEDLNIDYCSTEEKGNIVRGARGQYIFTKDINERSQKS